MNRFWKLTPMILMGCLAMLACGGAYAQPAETVIRSPGASVCDPDLSDQGTQYWIGCCGGPGRGSCPTTGCAGGATIKIDPFGAGIVCQKVDPHCDAAVSDVINKNSSAAGPRDLTLYMTSDTHYFRVSYNLPDQIGHVRMLNTFGSGGRNWPANVGMDSKATIGPPAAIILNGDLTTVGGPSELGAYRLVWERLQNQDSIQYPVLFGLGNHDIKGKDSSNSQRMWNYLKSAMPCGVHMDPNSGNYSWDMQGIHMIQLNTWADDQTSLYPHTVNGLDWLKNDLFTYVGNTTKPVMIFQHYGLASIDTPDVAKWWSTTDYQNFWKVIHYFNVVGMFTGHTHALGEYRPGGRYASNISPEDTDNYETILDDFDDGSAGYQSTDSFLVTRITDNYLDVVAVTSQDGGKTLFYDPQAEYVGNVGGCRKRINTRFIDISSSVHLNNDSQSSFTVTNNSGHDIPGPLAVRVNSLDPTQPYDATIHNPLHQDFVDSCNSQLGHAFYLLNGESGGLSNGSSTSIKTGGNLGNRFLTSKVFAMVPLSGAVPNKIDMTTASGVQPAQEIVLPDPQNVTLYGPPNTSFLVDTQIDAGPAGWLQWSGPSKFDSFGRATVTITFSHDVLAHQPEGNVAGRLVYTQAATGMQVFTLVSLHIKAPLGVSLSVNQASNAVGGATPIFKALLNYDHTVPQPSDTQNTFRATGTVSLRELTVDSKTGIPGEPSKTLATGVVRNGQGETCGATSWPDDTVVFGDTGKPQHYCAASVPSIDLPRGSHYIAAYYEGSGNGDNKFAPAHSTPILYNVTRQVNVTLTVVSGDLQSTLVGTQFSAPLKVKAAIAGVPLANDQITFSMIPNPIGLPGSGFFSGGPTTVFTDANGIAVSPTVFASSGPAGSWRVRADADGGLAPAFFTLRSSSNSVFFQPPDLLVTITSKTGTSAARNWQFTINNPSQAVLSALTLTSVTLSQESGAPCTPVVQSGVPFETDTLAPGAAAVANVVINFTGCAAAARFQVSANVIANGGAYTTTATIGHQFQ